VLKKRPLGIRKGISESFKSNCGMMEKYDSYKDSGVEWIGEIPENWGLIKTKRLINPSMYYQIGDGDHGSIKPSMYKTKGIPYIRVQNLSWDGSMKYDNLVFLSEDIHKLNNKSKLLPDDLLIAKTGATVGKICLLDNSYNEYNTTSSVAKLTVNKGKYLPKFYLYFFQSHYFQELVWVTSIQKSAQPGFNIDDLTEFYVIDIPLHEQTQIVSYLNKKTSLIDSLIKKSKRKIELLKEKRIALINEIVSGKKVWDGNAWTKPNKVKNSGVEWIGEIPSHWGTIKLKYQGDVIIGLSYKPDNQVGEENGVLVMRSSNVQNGKPSFKDNVYVNCEIPEKLRTKENDILICSRNGSRRLIGKNCLIPKENVGLTWGVFMTMYRSKSPKFFYWLLNSPIFESQSGLFLTSTINQLTVSTLENMIVPFVEDLNEQQQIVKYLDQQTQLIDKTVSIEEKRIALLKEYRQSLISNVVTGKIKVIKDE